MTILPNPLRVLLLPMLAIILPMSLTGCIQGQSMAATQKSFAAGSDVPTQTLRSVDRQLRQALTPSGWYYKGSVAANDQVNAYIKIPSQLTLDIEYQENYLKQSVCKMISEPATWRELEDISVWVHIYTQEKSQSVYARCDNPVA
ncbi:hypothetical protein HMF8227_01228 [Saliniradius amylolyticus]|uniref:Uncharacterized protein n=1 Tax=Saliniradius amylolyticus TaxID=2183582 RepID=A0A2S2E289_9ALTE|nr:hypothetical protein [Saliniradius amylolyticus]AWL11709.1 hypothetical protein HMF8227_01228 [Saliniradius amylolyticus]